MNQRTIIHLDMDAFFAAVEQRDFPAYRGKPVIVGADPQGGKGRGVVSTASYEARKFGIHSALPISQAYQRCPHGIFVKPRGARYQEISQQIMAILYDFTPAMEPISIDEAFLDVTGSLRLLGEARTIAGKIKTRICQETGLTASIGIAPNKFIAKIASDLEKPDGLVLVEPGQEKQFLAPLAIGRMWGVGKKSEPVFHRLGIHTIGDLAGLPVEKITAVFGKNGMHYWQLANGIDPRPVATTAEAKSISQEITFNEDTDDGLFLEQVIFELAENVGRQVYREHSQVKTVVLKIRLADFSTFTRRQTRTEFFNQATIIRQMALELFREFDCQGQKVRLIGVGVTHFETTTGAQLSLFSETKSGPGKVDAVIDLIENQFGKGAIQKATLLSRIRKHES
ncbi:DNA polymerase IV [candidate division KSB1 bacterium]|nr:DNA polymerase IV [candidate division KSB1 bacterium]